MQPFALLQAAYDFEQVACLGPEQRTRTMAVTWLDFENRFMSLAVPALLDFIADTPGVSREKIRRDNGTPSRWVSH